MVISSEKISLGLEYTDQKKTILHERKGKGIWQGLYQFPLIESQKEIGKKEVVHHQQFQELFPKSSSLSLFNTKKIIHKLSHQHLHTQFWIVKTHSVIEANTNWKNINSFPVPILIANFLNEFEP